MQVIRSRPKLLAYGFGAFGVNLLNLIVGSYLCSALIASGFAPEAIKNQTFLGIDLVVAFWWGIFTVIAKIIDGVIDIPLAHFTDSLKTRWGRRRPAILIGLVFMVIAYCCFLIIPNAWAGSMVNTVYFFLMLALFYIFYTLTMVTYYATFTEVVDNEKDRRFLSNTKSVADVFYFIVGFALVPIMLKGINIRLVALIVLPTVLLMLIPLFMLKEKSTKGEKLEDTTQSVNIFKSVAYAFKNKSFIIWMIVYSFMTFGLQLFLNGINEYFSIAGISMIATMAASFAPVPLTFIIYNKLIDKFGFKFAYQYTLVIFTISMLFMFGLSFMAQGTLKLVLSIVGGLFTSLAIGAMFAVSYSIPSQLAADEEKKTGVSNSAMYFAVQGLFSGVVAGLGGGALLTALKTLMIGDKPGTFSIGIVSAASCIIAFILCFFLPKSIKYLGKKNKSKEETPDEETKE